MKETYSCKYKSDRCSSTDFTDRDEAIKFAESHKNVTCVQHFTSDGKKVTYNGKIWQRS